MKNCLASFGGSVHFVFQMSGEHGRPTNPNRNRHQLCMAGNRVFRIVIIGTIANLNNAQWFTCWCGACASHSISVKIVIINSAFFSLAWFASVSLVLIFHVAGKRQMREDELCKQYQDNHSKANSGSLPFVCSSISIWTDAHRKRSSGARRFGSAAHTHKQTHRHTAFVRSVKRLEIGEAECLHIFSDS